MNGPTLNDDYNRTLASWPGNPRPECEECGKDMTGRDVFMAPGMWVCAHCWNQMSVDAHPAERERPDRGNNLKYVGNGYAVDSHGCYREAFWAGTP